MDFTGPTVTVSTGERLLLEGEAVTMTWDGVHPVTKDMVLKDDDDDE